MVIKHAEIELEISLKRCSNRNDVMVNDEWLAVSHMRMAILQTESD